jgi:hypothetical protein
MNLIDGAPKSAGGRAILYRIESRLPWKKSKEVSPRTYSFLKEALKASGFQVREEGEEEKRLPSLF